MFTSTPQTSSTGLYSLSLKNWSAWTVALAFIIGNIALPQMCHMIPNGGHIFLPIYFFTLVGAYKYGWQIGLLTATVSPAINCALFGMPALGALGIITLKGVLLVSAAYIATRSVRRISIAALAVAVLSAQIAGCAVESLIEGNLAAGFVDMRIGIPGILIQIFGGYAIVKYLLKK